MGIDCSRFGSGREIIGNEYTKLIKSLNNKPVIWTDTRLFSEDRVARISESGIKTELGESQIFSNHCHLVIYKGKNYVWWHNAYVLVETNDDKCGKCSSMCRSNKGKCGLYSEWSEKGV